MPSGIYHIAPAIFHISVRKYITFPPGKISLGVAKIPFRDSLWSGAYLIQLLPSWKKATALAAATFRESTPWVMGILTV